MDAVRKIKVFKSYYKEFYIAQTEAVRKKIDYVIELVKCLEVIPTEYFRKISDVPGLYEIRASHKGNIFRIFCCQDKGSLVILFQGFQKKTQKTPPSEIRKEQKRRTRRYLTAVTTTMIFSISSMARQAHRSATVSTVKPRRLFWLSG